MAFLAQSTVGYAKTEPAAKPAPKTQPAPKPAIQGADPMAGENAQLGTTYTFGKPAPLNFALVSAHYSLERVNIQEDSHAPAADQKLLVLQYSVHNPNKEEFTYDWGTIDFTVVDANGNNHEYAGQVGDPATKKNLSITLKPAQKTAAYTVIKVPGKGAMPKLIVKYGDAVLRYDLRGKVAPLTAPYADPVEKTGVTALAEVPAETGKFYPLLGWDAKLVKTEIVPGPLGDAEAGEDKRFLVATVVLKNAAASAAAYDTGVFTAELQGSDGEKTPFGRFFKTLRHEDAGGELKPGEEYTARFLFVIPKDVTGKKLSLSQPESRVYTYDLTATP